MKKLIIAFLIFIPYNAYAEEPSGWVIVDANNNVVSGTIVCTSDVCGDSNSSYAKSILSAGQRYMQITKADSNGNVAGPNVPTITPTPNQTVVAKVDMVKNELTITTTTNENFAPKVNVIKESVQTFNAQTANPVVEIKKPVLQITEDPVVVVEDPEFIAWLEMLKELMAQLPLDWNTAFTL